MKTPAIRLFNLAAYAWLALYMLAMLLLGDAAWTNAPIDIFLADQGFHVWTTRSVINRLAEGPLVMICLAIIAGSLWMIRRPRWWLGLLIWSLFRIITHRTWLASNGGVQLMENMLFWSSFMFPCSHARMPTCSHVSLGAFLIARLQLLLAYAAAAAHKSTGTTWLDGTAVLRVANDPLFHLGWLARMPWLCTALTYAVLAWMALFAFAVWWKPTRRIWLVAGVFFHIFTAVFMDIPQMGLAFIACYALWLDGREAEAVMGWGRRVSGRYPSLPWKGRDGRAGRWPFDR